MHSGIRPLFIALLLSIRVWAGTEEKEAARMLLHTVNYIAADYGFAVANGKVIEADEYAEQLEFVSNAIRYAPGATTGWPVEDSVVVAGEVKTLSQLIHAKAPKDELVSLIGSIREKVLRQSGLATAPLAFPDLQKGKLVYVVHCQRCHGETGHGDGPDADTLNPRPRNFFDAEKMKELSPFFAFNTIRLGVEGTGMRPHPQLSDEEVWNVAFHILSLRHQAAVPANADQLFAEKFKDLSLEKISNSNDEMLTNELQLTAAELATIRLHQPLKDKTSYATLARNYAEQAVMLFNQREKDKATLVVTRIYFEGIEPLEKILSPNNDELADEIEKAYFNFKKQVEGSTESAEVKAAYVKLNDLLNEAEGISSSKQYSFFTAFLMSGSILLREGLEAFLVLLIIISVVKSSGSRRKLAVIHAGWVSAILLGLVMWLVAGEIISRNMNHVELMEGIIALFSVGMLLYVGFWLHRKSNAGKWTSYIKSKLDEDVINGSLYGLFILSFFVVFREVFESVLFLSALNVESGGQQLGAILAGIGAALCVVLGLAVIVIRFSLRIPVQKLFRFSSIIMSLLAIVLTGKGIHAFQEAGKIPVTSLSFPSWELLGVYAYLEPIGAQVACALLIVVIWWRGKRA